MTCIAPSSVNNSSRSQEPPYNNNTSLTNTCDLDMSLAAAMRSELVQAEEHGQGLRPLAHVGCALRTVLLLIQFLYYFTYIVSGLSVFTEYEFINMI